MEEKKVKGGKLIKVKQFFEAHENIRQIVLFTLFSLICFAIEYISFAILAACLKNYNHPFDWFLFHYSQSGGGAGSFIAFLVSNILAQAATFVLNRKKTFKATNNVVISGIMFAIVVIAIIILNTYLGGVIGSAVSKSMINSGTVESTAKTVSEYAGKLVGSFVAWVLSFLGNKFLVMRNWGSKKKDVVDGAQASDMSVECAATDSSDSEEASKESE